MKVGKVGKVGRRVNESESTFLKFRVAPSTSDMLEGRNMSESAGGQEFLQASRPHEEILGFYLFQYSKGEVP